MRRNIKEAPMEVIGRVIEKGKYNENQKKLLAYLAIVALMGAVVLLSGFKRNPNPYVGIWKLQEIVVDGKRIPQDHVITLKIFPDGKFAIWIDLTPITGTYDILRDGRLQISEEFLGDKPIEPPTVSEWSLQGGKLIKSSRKTKTIFKKEEE
jgi:hypothetical protein